MASDHACTRCGSAFTNAMPLDELGRCAVCRRGLWGFDAAYSFGYYETELRRLLHIFKYEKVHTLARPLAKRMQAALPRQDRYDVIVPVPMHWRKRMARGFNQAELLSAELAKSLAIPVSTKALRRTKSAPAQASMSFAQRRAGMRAGAFAVRRPNAVAGRRVLLIDDVFTTGATARACARELKRAGAAHVTLLTLARVDRRPIVRIGRARATAATTGEM
ncbi:MAG: ComF family protein [Bryobacteraceae bacterium]